MKCQLRGAGSSTTCFVVALILMGTLPVIYQIHAEVTGSLEPSIQITVVPPKGGGPDRMATIAGKAGGFNPNECKVVIFTRTNTWYVQPYANAPYTSIDSRGEWQTQTHLGDEYAALLVKPSYRPPATTDSLPPVGGDVLAATSVPAKSEPGAAVKSAPVKAVRKLHFSGYEWAVKSSHNLVGPGPNYFSDNSDNVAVDAQGRLHLRITKREGRWNCAEIVSQRSFGYGTYTFYLETAVDQLDPRVVLGLFTWSDAPAFAHREIDVEVSRWGQIENQNGQFVVQPYTHPENIVRFEIPKALSTIHSFAWSPESVFCQSMTHDPRSKSSAVIYRHTFTQGIPKAGDENARINLWLLAGGPAKAEETEVIISKFEFLPLP